MFYICTVYSTFTLLLTYLNFIFDMKTLTKLVELRKIKNGKLFRLPPNNSLYVRDDYCSRCKSFKCHRFDSVESEIMLPSDTFVYCSSIADFY